MSEPDEKQKWASTCAFKDEDYAKKNKLGLWSGDFINPEKWRKLN